MRALSAPHGAAGNPALDVRRFFNAAESIAGPDDEDGAAGDPAAASGAIAGSAPMDGLSQPSIASSIGMQSNATSSTALVARNVRRSSITGKILKKK